MNEITLVYDVTQTAVEAWAGVSKPRRGEALTKVEDWLDYRLENHPQFLRRIAEARAAARQGLGVRLEEIEDSVD